MSLRFVSLFAGIGGIDLGLERAGWTCVGQVENDLACRKVLRHHWPQVWRHVEVGTLQPRHVPTCDALVGGFPCQPVSLAGQRKGIQDARWLWPEFHRLIRGVRSRWVVAENVPGLRTLGADAVLGDLEAAGYTTWACVVGAADVGAPHRRQRVWIVGRRQDVADANGTGRAPKRSGRLREGQCLDRETPQRWNDADRRHRWPARRGEAQHAWEPPRTIESPLGIDADGFSRGLARRERMAWLREWRWRVKVIGNSVCVPVVTALGQAILAMEQGNET